MVLVRRSRRFPLLTATAAKKPCTQLIRRKINLGSPTHTFMWVVSEKPFLTQAWRYSRRISHMALSRWARNASGFLAYHQPRAHYSVPCR